MSAKIESFPLPTSGGFGLKLRWVALAAALILAAVLGSIWAFQGSSSVNGPVAPAHKIQAPAQPGGGQAPAQGAARPPAPVPNPEGCGLSIKAGPC